MKRTLSAVVLIAGMAGLLPAQRVQTMRANIRGGGGDNGKCTVEVEVDGAADVEVRGDTGYIRTLQGQTATWRRLECTSPIPRNPANFRFRGIDGRGNVNLVRDPNSGGAAVIRIEDPKGGREGYTFDLEWSGGNYGNYGNSGNYPGNYPNNGGYGNRGNRGNGPYYPNDQYGRNQGGGYNSAGAAIGACQDAVRAKARRDFGVRNPMFTNTNANDSRGNRDRVGGFFEDGRGSRFEYNCSVNLNNGDIRSADVWRR